MINSYYTHCDVFYIHINVKVTKSVKRQSYFCLTFFDVLLYTLLHLILTHYYSCLHYHEDGTGMHKIAFTITLVVDHLREVTILVFVFYMFCFKLTY